MSPARTSTGRFPIGLRQAGGEWQQDPATLVRWAATHRFGSVDFTKKHAGAGLLALERGD